MCCLQEERQRAKALKKVNATVEPEVMARAMLRPEDDAIRATDTPEREQLRSAPAPETVDHDECARCAHAGDACMHSVDEAHAGSSLKLVHKFLPHVAGFNM